MRNRTHFTGLWLNEAEHRQLEHLCHTTGLSASVLLRKLILQTELSPHPPEVYAKMLRELSGIGNNVNQIAYWANARKAISEQELLEAIQLMKRCYALISDPQLALQSPGQNQK